MIEWNYISEIEKSNGYEDVIEELKSFKKEDYMLLPSEEERNKMIDEIFNIYRLKNIFPITYYVYIELHAIFK